MTPLPIDCACPKRRWLYRVAILTLVVVAYSAGLTGEFVFDDIAAIQKNVGIRDFANCVRQLPQNMRPVTELTLAVNYALGGTDTFGYHVFNVLAHAAAALVLFSLLRRTFELPRFAALRRHADLLAFAVAALWAVHPLNSQAVTYTVQRAQVLAGLFQLLMLYALLRGATASRFRLAWYAAAVVASLFAMGSKQDAVVGPILAIVFDRVFLAAGWRDFARRSWVHVALMATVLVLVLSIRFAVGGYAALAPAEATASPRVTAGFASRRVGPMEYALTQTEVVWHYLRLAVWPSPLCIDYYDWPIARSIADVPLGIAATAGLVVATIVLLWRRPPIGFLFAAFFLTLAPTSSVLPIDDVVFEHRMYLPLAAVVTRIVLASWSLLHRVGGTPKAFLWLVALFLITAVVATRHRTAAYQSIESLWRATLSVRPDNRRACHNLAILLVRERRTDEAITYFQQSAKLKPSPGTFALLAQLELDRGRPQHALPYLRRAVAEPFPDEDRDFFEGELPTYKVHFNLGKMLADAGEPEEAIAHYRRAAALHTDTGEVAINITRPLVALGRWEEAAEELRKGLRLNPNASLSHNNLALVLCRLNRPDEAFGHFQRAAELEPKASLVYANWGAALVRGGRVPEAISVLERGRTCHPPHPHLAYNLAHAYRLAGRDTDAAETYRKAKEHDPTVPAAMAYTAWDLATNPKAELRDAAEAIRLAEIATQATEERYTDALDSLAAAYAAAGRFDEAVNAARKAEQLCGTGQRDRAAAIRTRIETYRARTIYRQQPMKPPATITNNRLPN